MKKHTTSKKYTEFSKNTQTFMNAVEKHLINKFGEIEPQWEGLLSMLATQYEIFFKCKNIIAKEGLMVENRFGAIDKHPLLKTLTDAQIQCIKLVAEFGISPKALRYMPQNEDNDDEFLEELVK